MPISFWPGVYYIFSGPTPGRSREIDFSKPCTDRLAHPAALTAFLISSHSSIFFLLVMAFVNFDCKYRCFSAHFPSWWKSYSLKNLAFSFPPLRHRQLVEFLPFSFHAIFLFFRGICARSTIFFRVCTRMNCLTSLM